MLHVRDEVVHPDDDPRISHNISLVAYPDTAVPSTQVQRAVSGRIGRRNEPGDSCLRLRRAERVIHHPLIQRLRCQPNRLGLAALGRASQDDGVARLEHGNQEGNVLVKQTLKLLGLGLAAFWPALSQS